MRDELKDRFGEYPDEVEHLFRLCEFRLLAMRSFIQKVSIRKSQLILTLPPETDTAFYGTESDQQNTPFQRIMKMITASGKSVVRIQQDGKNLNLVFSNIGVDTPGRFDKIEKIFAELIGFLGQII